MRVIIKENYDSCSKWAASYIAGKINKAAACSDKPFVLGLPTGSTPLGTYKELIKLSVLETCEETSKSASEKLCAELNAEGVAVVGRKFVIYRESKENKRISIPYHQICNAQ